MEAAAVGAAYDLIAERWQDGRLDPAAGLPQHARALRLLDAAPGDWALSVGCGCSTRLNRAIRAHGLAIEGIDVSARMLDLARQADPDQVLHLADACDW